MGDRTLSAVRRMLGALAVLVAIAALGTAGAAWWAWHTLHTPVPPAAPDTVVVVPPGESFRAVVGRLANAGVLRHPLLLIAWARWRGHDRSVRSGEYRFSAALSPAQVLEQLQSNGDTDRVVTIPEGLTAAQIAALLEERGFGGRDLYAAVMGDVRLLQEFELPPSGIEGYLFPDTYAFDWATQPRAIVRTMLARFRRESAALAERRVAAGVSEAEMVTLASVIEKETGEATERRVISGVFHNRLRLGMPLQSDPTVLYGRDRSGPITRADLSGSSPYNTYLHRGLPPGPIANPGRAALEAAIDPAATAALFFVSRNDGSHEFSETLDAHNRAVRKYQPHRD